MHKLQTKLLRVKDAFKVWNRSVFGNVQRQVQLASDEVLRIQNLIDASGIDANLHNLELQAQMTLTRAMNCQDLFWREKARNQSFIHGDRNTTYFHLISRIKTAAKPISLLLDGQMRITDQRGMCRELFSRYFWHSE
jgi:hypothetical protein